MRKERNADKEIKLFKVGMEAFDIFFEDIKNLPKEEKPRDENVSGFKIFARAS